MWEFPVKSRQYYDYFSILATVCLLVRADVFGALELFNNLCMLLVFSCICKYLRL